jgi:hypothetical protein
METEQLAVWLPNWGPARQLLMDHWNRLYLEELLRLSTISPLNRNTEYLAEHMCELNENLEAMNQHVVRYRQIASYLGHELPPAHQLNGGYEPKSLSAISVARMIRVFFDNGESDETIASLLESWQQHTPKPGRPTGAATADGLALVALELHESDPKKWSWPRIADEFCEHRKSHAPHGWDSPCTASLKQSVKRLQKFLRELESTKPAPSAVK